MKGDTRRKSNIFRKQKYRPYSCKFCQKTYYRRYLMKRHIEKKHKNEKDQEESISSLQDEMKEESFASNRDWIDELFIFE